jgi:hypothetical protein
MAGDSAAFRGMVGKVAMRARAKAAPHGGLSAFIVTEKRPSEDYGRYDWFVMDTHPNARGIEFGHAFNFYQPGPVPDPGKLARKWIRGIHVMRNTARSFH